VESSLRRRRKFLRSTKVWEGGTAVEHCPKGAKWRDGNGANNYLRTFRKRMPEQDAGVPDGRGERASLLKESEREMAYVQ